MTFGDSGQDDTLASTGASEPSLISAEQLPVLCRAAAAVALLGCLTVAAGCTSNQAVNPSPSPAKLSPAPRPTPPCNAYTPDSVRGVVTAFLAAYNAGSPAITDDYIAPADEFQWYGAPDRPFPSDPNSTDRSTLPGYFAAEHAKGDHLDLKSFSYNGVTSNSALPSGAENFGYTLVHKIGNGPPRDAPGKGAVACGSGKIAVWLIFRW